MKQNRIVHNNVDEYIASFPADIQKKLTRIRKTIKSLVPIAEEKISYCMPAFFLNGVLVYYAAFKNHIGFFPKASGIAAFKKKLTGYTVGKGGVQFPLDEPIPIELIKEIVEFRIAENLNKGKPVKKK